jgi:hypothetical protein
LWYRIIGLSRAGERLELGQIEARRGHSASARPALLSCRPNPFLGAARLEITIPDGGGGGASVAVFDVRGRKIAEPLAGGPLAPGRHVVEWNGLDSFGRRLPAGDYFVRLETALGSTTTKITRSR